MVNKNKSNPITLPGYQLPMHLWFKLILAATFLQHRSFAADAHLAVSDMAPEPELSGLEHIPVQGPCLVTCNHYTRPGLHAWWVPLLVSSAISAQRTCSSDKEIHWI
ncbi:MAG: hypothetical protein P1S60_18075, partial [Anaerolineae bacterium]|nr:hypothetical protein [Anaerolineae bacterium]